MVPLFAGLGNPLTSSNYYVRINLELGPQSLRQSNFSTHGMYSIPFANLCSTINTVLTTTNSQARMDSFGYNLVASTLNPYCHGERHTFISALTIDF